MTLMRRETAALPMLTLMVRAPLRARRLIGTLNVPFLATRTVLRAMTFLPRLITIVTLPDLALLLPVTAKRESLPARSVAGALAVRAGASTDEVSAGAVFGAVVAFGVAVLLELALLLVLLAAGASVVAGALASSAGAEAAVWLRRPPPGSVADSVFEWTLSPSPDSPSLAWSSKVTLTEPPRSE